MEPRYEAELVDDGICLAAPSSVLEVKEIPGARFVENKWHLPLSWATCVTMRSVLGSKLIVGEKLTEWAKDERNRVDQVAEAREADAPAWEPDTSVRERGEDGEVPDPDVTKEWWYPLYQGMPEWINRRIDAWRTVKVHFRGPDDLEEFSRLVGQNIGPTVPALWYPKAEPLAQDEWRWVDEDSKPEDLPRGSRKPTQQLGRKPKSDSKPRTAKAGKPQKAAAGSQMEALLGAKVRDRG